jgi:hypothetical protein
MILNVIKLGPLRDGSLVAAPDAPRDRASLPIRGN